MPSVIEKLESVQYDGTNGSYIAETFLGGGTTVGSDDGRVLQLVDGMNDPTVPLGHWLIRRAAGAGRWQYVGVRSDADYQAMYTVLP
ncbi:hypothetical protein HRW07_10235 [Streptomyces lunaelactis]|uniref:hypothetical protein n=1 Tax=Streptomyces lunaelactis TaxID=1535768 RepID=UPI001584D70B|nr:hypothetical protein [Streptomyces lunaelactis]NUL03607.1 hypothetical protein [Streptomyces lunaelactis]